MTDATEKAEAWKAEQLRLKEQCAMRKAERELAEEEKALEKRVRKEVRDGAKGRGKGRPKGGSLSVALFSEMLEDGRAHSAVKTLEKVANDPDHKHWASAQKMLLDRVANISHFQSENAHGTPVVNITIGSVGAVDVEGEVIEHEP